jgi:hypothetical protein
MISKKRRKGWDKIRVLELVGKRREAVPGPMAPDGGV